MAFKQRSAFKAKEGGAAFKQMGSSESPMKGFFGKIWKGVKKVARNTPIGLGVRALRGDFKKGGGGAGGGMDPASMSYDDARSQLEGRNLVGPGGRSLFGGMFGGGGGSAGMPFGGLGGQFGGFMGGIGRKHRSSLIDKILAKKGFSNPTADTGSDVGSDPGDALRAAEASAMTKKSRFNKKRK